jgi:hypothetical protein
MKRKPKVSKPTEPINKPIPPEQESLRQAIIQSEQISEQIKRIKSQPVKNERLNPNYYLMTAMFGHDFEQLVNNAHFKRAKEYLSWDIKCRHPLNEFQFNWVLEAIVEKQFLKLNNENFAPGSNKLSRSNLQEFISHN